MATSGASFEEHLAELRRAFDASFAAPARASEAEGELFLLIRAGGERFAVRLGDIAGVHECRKIVPLPGGMPTLAGLAGIRGRLYAVHVLSALLGIDTPGEPIQWLLIAGAEEPLAFGVEAIEACVEVAADQLRPTQGADAEREHVGELLVREGATRWVLTIPSLLSLALQQAEPISGGRR
ncbi:chemotaxis protein CheW [Polyangium aurulentum]|uniref:chemotaxis protein CheW n=1 Tax=Polyangium aurulentum TaxID=2567896 RepID=UPI0010AE6E33|nr:chemotaxis protein CheW [Polyangium aurulentum]UQA60743.1 chemotaxis protein CheW [Polyangium aurulentum]